MGNILFGGVALLLITLGMVNRRAFLLLIVGMAGVPITLMTGNTTYFGALGGMSGQAAWLFAIVIGCLVALIGYLGRIHLVLARTPAFLLFVLFAAVSLTWAANLLDGVRMVARLSAPMLFFWVILAMRPEARLIRRVEFVLYGTCVFAGVLAFVNTLSGGVIGPLPLKFGVFGLPALSTPYASPANFSFLILCGTITAYCRFLASRSVVYFLFATFLAICVGLSFVRISIAAFVLGVAIIHLVRARPFATPVFAGIAVLAGGLIVTSDAFMHRMFFIPERVHWTEAITAPDKFMANVNTSGRTWLWARASRAFADESPWVGAGAGSVDAWIDTGDSSNSELHSEVFRLRLELGWIGLVVFVLGLVFLWLRLVGAFRTAAREHQTIALRASCALLPMYVLTLLTDNSLNYAAGFGVIVYGFAAFALLELAQRERAAAKAPRPQHRHTSPIGHESVASAR